MATPTLIYIMTGVITMVVMVVLAALLLLWTSPERPRRRARRLANKPPEASDVSFWRRKRDLIRGMRARRDDTHPAGEPPTLMRVSPRPVTAADGPSPMAEALPAPEARASGEASTAPEIVASAEASVEAATAESGPVSACAATPPLPLAEALADRPPAPLPLAETPPPPAPVPEPVTEAVDEAQGPSGLSEEALRELETSVLRLLDSLSVDEAGDAADVLDELSGEEANDADSALDLLADDAEEESDTERLAASLPEIDADDLLEQAQGLVNELGGSGGGG